MARGLSLHGAHLSASAVQEFVETIVTQSMDNDADPIPVCIWGMHGIGKTTLVEEIAHCNAWKFAYAAPAQFEEMGDLHGLPVVQGNVTSFAKPDWVPTEPGPGILLLDDLNRADDRILRGLMQLLQRSELVSWALPDNWHIIVTANPEGGDYSVTPMDDAMLTRMLHVTLKFDPRAWASWAVKAGVDERGVGFVLTYPEAVTGSRTTPRSLTQLFEQLKPIEDLQANEDLVNALALSALDEATAVAFMSFVNDGQRVLLSPDEILSDPWPDVSNKIKQLASDENGLRLDLLNAMSTRLLIAVSDREFTPTKKQSKNLIAFLKHESLPADLRQMLHGELISQASPEVAEIMRDKDLAKLILDAI